MASAQSPSTFSAPFPWRALLLVVGIGIFYAATIREGHVWGDDQAAYIGHARNIVEGNTYGDIGYIRAPTSINVLMYPPVFPLLLAPIYHFFGLSQTPMKIECIVFFCLALYFVYLLLREHGEGMALITVAAVGLCPYFWDFKDTLVSEYPFLTFAFASLWAAGKAPGIRGSIRREILLGALVGLLIGLAYGARTVGVILTPVIIFFDFWKTRRITAFCVTVAAVSLVVALAQNAVFQINSDYLTPYKQVVSVRSLAGSPVYYLKCFSVLWENGYSVTVQWVLFAVMGVLGLKGLWTRIRAGWSILEVFSIAYFLFVCLFPWGGRRYLMPVIPFFFFYILVGLRAFAMPRPASFRLCLYGATALLVVASFLGRYLKYDWRKIPGGEQSEDAIQLVEFLKSDGQGTGPIVFEKARWLAFRSGLTVADIYNADNKDEFTRYYEQIGATRFVVSRIFHDKHERDLNEWVEYSMNKLVRRFENDSFTVYALQ